MKVGKLVGQSNASVLKCMRNVRWWFGACIIMCLASNVKMTEDRNGGKQKWSDWKYNFLFVIWNKEEKRKKVKGYVMGKLCKYWVISPCWNDGNFGFKSVRVLGRGFYASMHGRATVRVTGGRAVSVVGEFIWFVNPGKWQKIKKKKWKKNPGYSDFLF